VLKVGVVKDEGSVMSFLKDEGSVMSFLKKQGTAWAVQENTLVGLKGWHAPHACSTLALAVRRGPLFPVWDGLQHAVRRRTPRKPPPSLAPGPCTEGPSAAPPGAQPSMGEWQALAPGASSRRPRV